MKICVVPSKIVTQELLLMDVGAFSFDKSIFKSSRDGTQVLTETATTAAA